MFWFFPDKCDSLRNLEAGFVGLVLCNMVLIDVTVSEKPSASFFRVGYGDPTMLEIEPRFPVIVPLV
jgi:hypothetical protein